MDNKNLLLALVLSIGILLAWQLFLVPDYAPPPQQSGEGQTAGTQGSPSGEAVPGTEGASGTPSAGTPAAGGEAAPGSDPAIVKPREEVLTENQRVAVEGPRVTGSINLTGGQLDDLVLSDYRETLDPTSPNIVLLSPRGTEHPYYAGVRWLALDGVAVPDAETEWQASGGPLSPDSPVTLSATIGGITYEVVYSVDRDYLVTITQRVVNGSEGPATVAPYALINRTGIPKLDATFVVHEGLFGMLNDSYQEWDYDDLMEAPNGIVSAETTGGWIGITDKYWSVILLPDQQTAVKARNVYQRTAAGNVFQSDVTYPTVTVEPGQTHETTVSIYAGAREATVELDMEVESLAELERGFEAIGKLPAHKEWGAKMEPLIVSGTSRWEIYRII